MEFNKSYNILLVEDDKSIRTSLSEILKYYGYNVFDVSYATTAVEELDDESKHFDLIICDILMPEMDGYEFLLHVRKHYRYKDILFVLLSGMSDIEDKIKGLDKGADEYITKPFDVRELVKRLESIFRFKERIIAAVGPDAAESVHTFVTKVNGFVEEHLSNKDLDLKLLADFVGMSISGTQKKIERLTGKSFSRYIREYRLERAKDMLLAGAMNINEITEKVGFGSVSYFSKCFKDYLGYSPSKLIK